MKNGYILVLAIVSLMAFNAFGESEMDSEINDLQVRIIHVKPQAPTKKVVRTRPDDSQEVTPKIYTYTARPAVKTAVTRPIRANFYKPTVVSKPTYIAANDTSVAPVTPVAPIAPAPTTRHQVDNNGNTNSFQASENYQSDASQSQPEETVRAPAPKSSIFSRQLVRRIELIPAFTLSSFDGGDAATLQPSGVSNTSNTGFSGQLLTDIDFGNEHFFVESGFMISQMGAGTGLTNGNGFGGSFTTTSEKESLTYAGVPLNLKLRFRDQDQSSFFVKAGGTPMYMLSHNYSTTGTSLFINPEQRFGAYNTFDLLLDAGVGYDFKISKDFHAIADISAFQGLFPVLTNYSVFNYGVNLGLGIAYML